MIILNNTAFVWLQFWFPSCFLGNKYSFIMNDQWAEFCSWPSSECQVEICSTRNPFGVTMSGWLKSHPKKSCSDSLEFLYGMGFATLVTLVTLVSVFAHFGLHPQPQRPSLDLLQGCEERNPVPNAFESGLTIG